MYRFLCPGQEKKGEWSKGMGRGGGGWGVGRDRLYWWLQGSASSPTGIGSRVWFEVLWDLECRGGFSQREICAHFSEGNLAHKSL